MSTSQETESHSSDYSADDLRSLGDVRAVLTALTKLIQGKKIYAKNNPTLAKFAKEFETSCQEYFAQEDELELTIEQYVIKWRDQVVYENEKREESIAFLLYKDGIGEIVITSAVTRAEIGRFVDLLKEEVHNTSPDKDMVTKLWRADFENVHYRVLDEYLVGEFGDGTRSDGDEKQASLESEDHPEAPSFADTGRIIIGADDDHLQPIDAYLYEIAGRSESSEWSPDAEENFQDLMESFFTVSSEELKLCQEEIAEENSRDKLAWFFDTILPFLLVKDNPSVLRDASDVIDSIVDYVIREREPLAMGRMLRHVKAFRQQHALPENVATLFETLENKFVDATLLESMGEPLKSWGPLAEDVFAYYSAAGKPALGTICKLLEKLDGSKLHRAGCDVILDIADGDIDEIVQQLSMDKPAVARDVVYLIRASQPEDMPVIVSELAHYPDQRVRDETIAYLADVASDEAIDILFTLLYDSDKHTRLKTMAAIGDIPDMHLRDNVVALAFDKELGKKPSDEQEQIFRTLGRVAGEGIVPRLRQMTEKKSLFGISRGGSKNAKLLVIRALENLEGAEARKLLRDLAGDSNDLVRSKARRVLDKVTEAARSQEG